MREVKKELSPALLIRAVDDYLEAVCEGAVRAKDAGSSERMGKLEGALRFAHEIYNYLGVKTI